MNLIKEVAGILLGKDGQGTLKAHMVRGTVGTFALKVVNTVLAFGTSLLLARLLGAKEYGVYAYAISWAQLLAVPAVLGLNTLLVREVAKHKALEDWASLKGILRWSDRVVLATSIGLAGIFALIVWALQGRFDPEVRMALWLAMALVPLLSFLLLRQGGLQGLGYVVEAQIPQFLILPVFFLVLAFAVYFTVGLSGTAIVWLRVAAGAIAASIAVILLRKHSPKIMTNIHSIYQQKEWLKSALPLLLVGAAGIVNQRASTIIVGSMRGAKAAGIFDITFKASILVNFTQLVVSWPFSPIATALYARGEKELLQLVVTKSARIGARGAVVLALAYILFGRTVLSIFGKEFPLGAGALTVLSIGQLANALAGPVVPLLNMTNHERDVAKWMTIGIFVNIAVGLILVPAIGILGASLSNALSIILWSVFLSLTAYKKVGINTSVLSFTRENDD